MALPIFLKIFKKIITKLLQNNFLLVIMSKSRKLNRLLNKKKGKDYA